jgi:chromatin segregation and condensation protein Rec8/ScpA/Scc1 (kleisin family)
MSRKRVKYPEHEKLQRVQKESEVCGEFLEWLKHERRFVLARFRGDRLIETYYPVSTLLASFFKINEKKLELEKRAMLAELRKESA